MTTTLSEGVKVPDVGSVNWAGDLEVNWNLLNGALANLSGNVKLDRDNTWAGEQSFTLPIVGSITGTASKAIADEDGTSIKTGYGKLAGSQTWTGTNKFESDIYIKNISYAVGTTPTANYTATCRFTDVNSADFGYVRSVMYSSDARTTAELKARNKFKNGALDTTGDYTESVLTVGLTSTGVRYMTFNGYLQNNLLPITTGSYQLGSSSYQWSSVYAQTYYYNGTAWGLDKANVWTGSNTFKSANVNFTLQSTTAEAGSTTVSSNWISWLDKNGSQDAYISRDIWSEGSDTLRVVITGKRDNGAPSTSGASVECGIRLDITANGSKSVRPYTNGDTDLGTFAIKFKTLNGVNPGALSLPDLSSDGYVDLSSNISANTQYTYTAPSDGWLCLYVQTSGFHAENAVAIFNGAGTADSHRWANSAVSSINLLRMGVYHGAVSVPVRAGNTYLCYVNIDSSTSLSRTFFYFYKAQGNV